MGFGKLILFGALSSLCNTAANALWKSEFAVRPIEFSSLQKILSTFFSLPILAGIFFYIASMMIFFYLLSNFKLSMVIPVLSLTYLFNMVSAVAIFKEKISGYQITGTAVIIIGIILISQAPLTDKLN